MSVIKFTEIVWQNEKEVLFKSPKNAPFPYCLIERTGHGDGRYMPARQAKYFLKIAENIQLYGLEAAKQMHVVY